MRLLLSVCLILLLSTLCQAAEPVYKATGIYALPTPQSVPADAMIVPYSTAKDLQDFGKAIGPTKEERLVLLEEENASLKERLAKIEASLVPKVAKTTSAPIKPSLNYTPWYETNGRTSAQHLINHGADPAVVALLTPEERNYLHGKYHSGSATVQRQIVTSNCPFGNCPINVFRGRRRR